MKPQLTLNQQKVYDALTNSETPLTIRQIESQIDMAYISIRSALTSLQKKGLAERDESVPRDQPWSLTEGTAKVPSTKPKPTVKKAKKKPASQVKKIEAPKPVAELPKVKEKKALEQHKGVEDDIKDAVSAAEDQLKKTKKKFELIVEKVISEVQKQGSLSKKQAKKFQSKLKKNPLYKKDKETVEKVIKNMQKDKVGKSEVKKLKKLKKDVLK